MKNDEELARLIVDTDKRLREDRAGFENLWSEAAEFTCPRLNDFNTKSQGGQRTRKVYDTTAITAAELLASAIVGIVANPAAQWCFLRFVDEENNDNSQANQWLEECSKIILSHFNQSQANFAQAFHETISSLVVFGTSGLYEGYSQKDGHLFFSSHFLGDFALDEDVKGKPVAWFRRIELTARQYAQMFPETMPERVKASLEANRFDDKFEVIHAIYERGYFMMQDNGLHAFKSVYVGENRVLAKKGYYEQPFFSPRWGKSSVEKYGRSPAVAMLPDIKMLQAMMKETLISAQLSNRPPLLVRDDDEISDYDIVPGAVLRYSKEVPQPFAAGANFTVSLEMLQEVRNRIRIGFYNDQLMFQNGVQMTATEVLQRTEEKMRLMAPILGRIQSELLGPLVERAFGLLRRANVLPPEPEGLEGKIQVRYASPLETAQRKATIEGAQQFVAFAQAVLQLSPQAADGIDFDEIIRNAAEALDMKNAAMTKPDLKKIREQRQEEAMRQQAIADQMTQNELTGQALNNEAVARQIANGGG